MADKLDTTRAQQAAFVQALQKTVKKTKATRRDFDRLIQEALGKNKIVGRGVSLRVRSEDGDDGTLRTLEPTPSVAKAEVDPSLKAHSVEFYLTRPSDDGAVETRLLGIAKYPNSDNQWGVRFTTDRFANSGQEIVAIHAEVLGGDGNLLAAAAIGAIA